MTLKQSLIFDKNSFFAIFYFKQKQFIWNFLFLWFVFCKSIFVLFSSEEATRTKIWNSRLTLKQSSFFLNGRVVSLFCENRWQHFSVNNNFLKTSLDTVAFTFNWAPTLHIQNSVELKISVCSTIHTWRMSQIHFSMYFPYKKMKYSNFSLTWFQELFLRALLSVSLCVLHVCIFLAVTTFLRIPKGATNCVIRKLTPTSGKTGINHKQKKRWNQNLSSQYFFCIP